MKFDHLWKRKPNIDKDQKNKNIKEYNYGK